MGLTLHRAMRDAFLRRPTVWLIAGLIVVLAIILAVAGVDPRSAASAVWSGAFGSSYALSSTLIRSL